jgi:hypothetical protein
MAEQIDLVYPLYLDVPMMTSFAAALQDGIAYGSDVTQRTDQSRSISGEGEGRAGFPFMSIFSTLLALDARGKIAGNRAAWVCPVSMDRFAFKPQRLLSV